MIADPPDDPESAPEASMPSLEPSARGALEDDGTPNLGILRRFLGGSKPTSPPSSGTSDPLAGDPLAPQQTAEHAVNNPEGSSSGIDLTGSGDPTPLVDPDRTPDEASTDSTVVEPTSSAPPSSSTFGVPPTHLPSSDGAPGAQLGDLIEAGLVAEDEDQDGAPPGAPTESVTVDHRAISEPHDLEVVERVLDGGVAAAARRPLPRVIAVANQKGGVGKTTTSVNLGACLAELGYRTLVVDLDPQGNASTGLGINIRSLETSMYDVIISGTPLDDCIEGSSVRGLFVAPASLDLAGAEIELVPAFSRELKLKQAFAEVRDDYDYIIIDCPPSLGLLTVNALAAATEVLVPIQCEYYALEGLGQLLRNVELVQRNLNPDLEVSAIALVMFDARTKLADQVAREVRAHFGDKVLRQIVPRTVRLSEAPSFGQPIITFDPSSRGAIAYREMAKEVSGGSPQRTG